MALVAEAVYVDQPRRVGAARAALAVSAIVGVGVILCLAGWTVGFEGLVQRAPKSPFSVGLQEAPPYGALGAFILHMQSHFYAAMTSALGHGEGIAAGWRLIVLCFCYGVLHAAGPGHGKAVVASFVLADRPAIRSGVLLCAAAAAVQATVAIGVVGVFAVLLHATAASIGRITGVIEQASFVAIVLYGGWLTWAKAGGIIDRAPMHTHPQHPAGGVGGCRVCGATVAAALSPRGPHAPVGFLTAALAAGLRPCSGAIIVLAFALSKGVWGLGVMAVLAMALGTTCTTAGCALTAVFIRRGAMRGVGRQGSRAAMLVLVVETQLGACVFWLGIILLGTIR